MSIAAPSTAPTRSARQRRSTAAPWLLLAPFLIIFALFTAYPLVQSLLLSLRQTYGPGTSKYVGVANYEFIAADPLFWKAVYNTTIYTLGSVLIQLPLALGLAMLVNHPRVKARAFFRLCLFAPSLVGVVFVAMIFAIMFDKRTGLINVSLFHATSMLPESMHWDLNYPWLQGHIMPALIIASLWMWVGFNMIYFLAALQNVPQELTEAATVDGAGAWRRFVAVTIPAIKPIAGFVVLLSVIGSFQLFELPWIILNNTGGPDNRGLTIMAYLYQTGFESGDLGYASAIGWVLAAILIVCAGLQRASARGEEGVA